MREIIGFHFLIATVLLTSCISATKPTNCENFKNGRFEIHSNFDNSISIIDRNDSIQTETDSKTGQVTKARINWTTECEYELFYFTPTSDTSDKIDSFLQSRPLKTIIIKNSEDYYIFKSSMEGIGVTLVDTMRVLR